MFFLNCHCPVYFIANVGALMTSLLQVVANHGSSFLVALPCSDRHVGSALIFVTPYNSIYRINLTWAITNSPDPSSHKIIGESEIATIFYSTNANQPFAIHVCANNSVVMFVILIQHDKSFGAFIPSPKQQLSSRYLAVTQCEINNCVLLIASPYDDVIVSVNFQLTPNNASVTYKGSSYNNGDVLNLYLGALQTVQLNSGTVDLTGSVVTSSLPVQVILAGDMALSTKDDVSDVLIEQMPTEDLFGTKFVLVNFVTNKTATIIKVVYTEENTKLTLNPSNLSVISNNSKWTSFNFLQREFAIVCSDKLIIVELIFGDITGIKPVSVASVIVVPVTRWAARYVSIIWTGTIALVTTQACVSNISINKTLLISWSQISDKSNYFYSVIKVSDHARYVLTGKGGCTFWGYTTHQNGRAFIANQIGWSKIESTSSLSSTTYMQEHVRKISSSDIVYSNEEAWGDGASSSPHAFTVVTTDFLMPLSPLPASSSSLSFTTKHITYSSALVSTYSFIGEGIVSFAPTKSMSYFFSSPASGLEETALATRQSHFVTTQTSFLDDIDNLATSYESIKCFNNELTSKTDHQTSSLSIIPTYWTNAFSYTQYTTDNIINAGISIDGQITSETIASTDIYTLSSVDIRATTEESTDQLNGKLSAMDINGTAQCACQCGKKRFFKITGDSTYKHVVKVIQKDLQLEKEKLKAYTMTKNCLVNVESSAKYIGFTFCLVVVLLICGSLFSFVRHDDSLL